MTTWMGKGIALIALLIRIRAERRALFRLTNDELRDLGVSRDDVRNECRRSLFDIPANRLKRRQLLQNDSAIDDGTRQSVARFR